MVHLATFTFSMVATIVQLRAHGLHIAINEFSYARTVQHIIDHVCEVNKCNNNYVKGVITLAKVRYG